MGENVIMSEIRDLAEASGYVVASFSPHPFPHVVLVPLGRSSS